VWHNQSGVGLLNRRTRAIETALSFRSRVPHGFSQSLRGHCS
jgi:hypothetical protein